MKRIESLGSPTPLPVKLFLVCVINTSSLGSPTGYQVTEWSSSRDRGSSCISGSSVQYLEMDPRFCADW
ncbi:MULTISPECIES: hypothetical protein [Metallosphaera]|nr:MULTISPECIES: hypothetical protein [Metallosphaera]MCY0863085.1 hypothetical protein [Metallosphaera prunae]WPX07369.1 hypothetical protein SOJ17_001132 [Metallosphaera sedula DSM 5348]BBL47216.1 hypothetical protein MJ1HA_1317 [Metallosphaera sedula]